MSIKISENIRAPQGHSPDFGLYFFGPLISYFLSKLPAPGKNIYFVAREGYWLSKAYSVFHRLAEEPVYLLTSRTFMYKLLLDNPDSYSYSLSGDFDGTLYELLRSRFMISDADIQNCFATKVQKTKYILPYDFDKLCNVLGGYQDELAEIVAPTKLAYMQYLNGIGALDEDELHLVDIGYSGTIQKLLTLLLNKNTHGHYLIASKPGTHSVGQNIATMRGCLRENVKLGDGYLPLDRSMFLEALLTSPQGQFQDIRLSDHPDKQFDYYFGRKVNSQKYFHELEQIMLGALSYVDHAVKHNITFEKEEVETLITQFVAKPNMIPKALWHLFSIDDDVTGNSTVDALEFFGLKT